MSESINISNFNYFLPKNLIAQNPEIERSNSRLLHIDSGKNIHDLNFCDLAEILEPGDLLVFNDTKVIKARLKAQKPSGGKIEILIERILDSNIALAQIKSNSTIKLGTKVLISNIIEVDIFSRSNDFFLLNFSENIAIVLEKYGDIPLPPYIKKQKDNSDELRYQTIFAKNPGAVAAPTAGLHFDQKILKKLKSRDIKMAFLTLHVGAGTFQPIRTQYINEHRMHTERYDIPSSTIKSIKDARLKGKRIIAVGTTSARALESAALNSDNYSSENRSIINPVCNETNLFIKPGYKFKIVDALITNFHLPKSTLLILVSALAGRDRILKAYNHAVKYNYRFFSYGDAMFVECQNEK
ncbi:S-adenosylmethionine:tRNA ribosyltransferase-isomerase [Candidatus Kinetoplastibacterium blastocrithidii TCC012E]|uniref:S-adenosylmethionine:tRNA ribosyltransferase-isomerase n=1 Tax=Candidatus Kinetoplastidibacterium blastocrithidiae TCC012E TaxID=1208922 RepID=M1M310_9PROT|nr:tRNA preQ1(34) S-adenosylmethionine ribosyltransferase-isomerase QueA [Candidatus Kinetoplastibacterium blastocrithidii]AFZ83473.1 S-adenosylmethionine:tRNA ribosyltransferase-isomerase [Candidatus Kinetoplastibacterium blastocrithidii (ex Strigomonas culicis)]AGF49569.1 S-adenosylmethionine:tRNA ribosyltransferase-isomerase [Candidatus Kinetoplastibacterium blastocrithidii TCC012E]